MSSVSARETLQQGPPSVPSLAYERRWIALLFICISLLVVSLDNTILNNALTPIASDLQATASDLQWIVDAYILVFASLLLTTGSLGDRIGRKRALQGGLVLFGIGSLFCAFSNTTALLTASRAFLGIGGALILPATLSIISATFPAEERPRAIGMWAAVFGLGVGLGPLIGGGLLQFFHWNSVFFVNLPIIVIALIGGRIYITDSRDEHAPRTDILGVILSILGFFALVYAIVEAGSSGWTEPRVLLAFAAAGVLLVAFGVWEARYKYAMLPMYFFRNPSFTGANVTLVLVSFALIGSTFLTSQYLQAVLGFTPLVAGLHILPLAVTLMITSILSPRVASRIGVKYTVAIGTALAGLGLLLLAAVSTTTTGSLPIILCLMLMSGGLGTSISPSTNSIMGSIPVDKAGVGSAMNDTTRQLGGALGVAVLGTVLNTTYRAGIAPSLEQAGSLLPQAAADAIRSSIQGAHIVANNPAAVAFRQTILDATNSAYVTGMQQALVVGGLIMFGAALIALATLPHQVQAPTGH